MTAKMKISLFLATLLMLPVMANADNHMGSLEGKINGISCAIAGVVCPIDKLDPLVALEKDFVLQQPDGSFYLMPNVDRAVKARLVLDDAIVVGEINDRYKSIEVAELKVRRGGEVMTVWSQQIQDELQKELFGTQR